GLLEIVDPDTANLRECGVEILFGPDPGATRRADGPTRKLDLISRPLDGVSDGHGHSSRTAGSRAASHPWQHTRSGRRSRAIRDPPSATEYHDPWFVSPAIPALCDESPVAL